MDGHRIDAISRTVGSRRLLLGGLLAGAWSGLLGVAGQEEASAHTYTKRCLRLKVVKKRQACMRRARAHNRTHNRAHNRTHNHRCKAQPIAVTCGGRCGVQRNNCGKAVACFCPPGQTCLVNGSCALLTCSTLSDCPDNCSGGCLFEDTEGVTACDAGVQTCSIPPCTSTLQCPVGYHCRECDFTGPNVCVPLCV